ncbi:MAG: hypothetical protein J6328_01530 [Bacilli bacterium]|nr:hypothetical protein [Bacilli bacterium]
MKILAILTYVSLLAVDAAAIVVGSFSGSINAPIGFGLLFASAAIFYPILLIDSKHASFHVLSGVAIARVLIGVFVALLPVIRVFITYHRVALSILLGVDLLLSSAMILFLGSKGLSPEKKKKRTIVLWPLTWLIVPVVLLTALFINNVNFTGEIQGFDYARMLPLFIDFGCVILMLLLGIFVKQKNVLVALMVLLFNVSISLNLIFVLIQAEAQYFFYSFQTMIPHLAIPLFCHGYIEFLYYRESIFAPMGRNTVILDNQATDVSK